MTYFADNSNRLKFILAYVLLACGLVSVKSVGELRVDKPLSEYDVIANMLSKYWEHVLSPKGNPDWVHGNLSYLVYNTRSVITREKDLLHELYLVFETVGTINPSAVTDTTPSHDYGTKRERGP